MDITVSKREAAKSDFIPYQLGALAVKKGKIVSKAFNTRSAHGRMTRQHGYFGGHAEANALINIDDCDTIFVIRVKKNGNLSMSLPCELCMSIIKSKGIKKIIYTDWCGDLQVMKL